MSNIHTDLSTVQISAAPSPATSGTSLGVSDANAALLPDIYPWWGLLRPHNAKPTRSNSEIVKVTTGSSSGGVTTYTIDREEGLPVTTAQSVDIGWDLSEVHTAQKQIDTEQPIGSIFRQALINPNCQVNQLITAVNLTSGKLFGPVDMFYAKGAGTAVSAGTITQSTTANVGNSGYALKLAGVTLTGTGLVYAYTFIESLNAKLYKNKTASFSVKVYHDVGSAIDYTIKINKANSADNFSAVTEIAAASAVSVPNTTETLIKFQNVSLGDCSNGIEIEIEASCGAITTKNFEFTDWQFNEGSIVLPVACENYTQELLKSMKFIDVVITTVNQQSIGGLSMANFTTNALCIYQFTVPMFRVPDLIAAYSDFQLTDWTTVYNLTGIEKSGSPVSSNRQIVINVTSTGLTQFRPHTLIGNTSPGKKIVFNARPTIA